MASADPADQQREILRAFRMAVADRASGEAAADARFKQVRDVVEARRARAAAMANRQLETTLEAAAAQRDTECGQIEDRFKQEVALAESQIVETRASLQVIASKELPPIGVELDNAVTTVDALMPANRGTARPSEALAQAAQRVQTLSSDLRVKIKQIKRVREQRYAKVERRLFLGFGLALLLVLALAYWLVRVWFSGA